MRGGARAALGSEGRRSEGTWARGGQVVHRSVCKMRRPRARTPSREREEGWSSGSRLQAWRKERGRELNGATGVLERGLQRRRRGL